MELVETMDVEFLIVYSLIRVRWFDLLTIKDKKIQSVSMNSIIGEM